MKLCSSCRTRKPLTEFHRGKGGYQVWCKACRKVYDREYHRRTKPIRLEQKRRWAEDLYAWYQELKRRPCTDCGQIFHIAAMTFDHSPVPRSWARSAT